MDEKDRTFFVAFRQALLMIIDSIERYLDISPRTADIRKKAKREKELAD